MKGKLDIEDGPCNPLESGNRRCQFPTVLAQPGMGRGLALPAPKMSTGWVVGWHCLPPKCPKILAIFKEV